MRRSRAWRGPRMPRDALSFGRAEECAAHDSASRRLENNASACLHGVFLTGIGFGGRAGAALFAAGVLAYRRRLWRAASNGSGSFSSFAAVSTLTISA